MKKPVNNFSEDELYPPKPSPVHNPPFPHHTATSPLSHKHVTMNTTPASLDNNHITSAPLPANLTGPLAYSEDRQSGELPTNQITGTRLQSKSHTESNDTYDGSVPQVLPPVADMVTGALADSNSTPEIVHHRSNSDFFVTPSSSPPSSPRLAARVSQRAPSRPVRVGQRSIQTFFSKAPNKFEDIVLVENDRIPTVEFLECCKAVVPFLGKSLLVKVQSLRIHGYLCTSNCNCPS